MRVDEIKPFWKKIFITAVITLSVSILLIIITNTCVLFFELQKEAQSNLNNIVNLSDKIVYSYFNQVEYSINNRSVVYDIVNTYEKKKEYISLQAYRISLEDKIKEYYFSLSEISGVFFNDIDDTFVSVGQIDSVTADNIYNELVRNVDEPNQYEWRTVSIDDKKYIAYYKNISYLDQNFEMHTGGKMLILIDEELAYKNTFLEMEDDSTKIFALDGLGYICCGGVREYVGRRFDDIFEKKGNFFVAKDSNRLYHIQHAAASVEGWNIVGIIPVKNIYKPIILIILSSTLILLLSVTMALFIFYKVSSSVNVPLIQLSQHLKDVENGHYEMIETIDDKTEIGFLYYAFNDMVKKLDKQFNENYLLNLKIQEAYIRTLEQQINPHFIFNTLQLIQMIALTGRVEDAVDVCGHFGEVVRFNLHEEAEVRINDEVENLINYFKILEFRYYGEFEYSIVIPDEIKDFYVIKFLLQPIVENAMQHAFVRRKGKCKIDILAKYIKNEIVFIIKDNGIGISEERLKEITDYINNTDNISSRKSIGLKNSNQRIKILYGEQFGIKLYSREGKGTSVLVYIPACEKKRYFEKEEGQTNV